MKTKSTSDSRFEPDNNTRFHLFGLALCANHAEAITLIEQLTRSERTSLMLAVVQLAGLCAEDREIKE